MLHGKLVNLRPYEMSDLDDIMEWINDSEIRPFLMMVLPISRIQEIEFLQQRLCKPTNEDIILAIETKDGIYLGGIGLHRINYFDCHAEVGIVIGKKEYRGKGYGTDAMLTVLNYAFNQLNLHKVYLHVYSFNKRGIRSYEKCGFKREGLLKEHVFKKGKYHDVLRMGILKKEFRKLK